MRVNTNEYINTHGVRPKGRGHWVFSVTGTDGEGRYTTYQGCAYGTVTEAKKTVTRNFKNEVGGVKKVVEITVLP